MVVIGTNDVSGVLDNTTGNSGGGGVFGDEDVFVPAPNDDNRGEKEKCSVPGGEGGAGCVDDLGLANISGGFIGEEVLAGGLNDEHSISGDIGDSNVRSEGGANVSSGEESSGGANVSTREESSGGGAIGGGASARVGNSVGHIPLIPRRRLREILAHAQGECIMLLSVFIVCK